MTGQHTPRTPSREQTEVPRLAPPASIVAGVLTYASPDKQLELGLARDRDATRRARRHDQAPRST